MSLAMRDYLTVDYWMGAARTAAPAVTVKAAALEPASQTAALLATLFKALPVDNAQTRALHATLVALTPLEALGFVLATYLAYRVFSFVVRTLSFLLQAQPPRVVVAEDREESENVLSGYKKFDFEMIYAEQTKPNERDQRVHLFDPATLDYFGSVPCTSPQQVVNMVASAREAQKVWCKSSFAKRRLLMRTLQRFLVDNAETCARVSSRESGKTMLDAMIGEILVSCEKLAWLAGSGEQCLAKEYREVGRMMIMKRVWVEYTPVGVVGAIVPWNYPCHNVFNPVSAALFSGNAIVIKVSEFASWSIGYYKRVIDACLDAVGAPRDLVQFVVGYGAAGRALVSSKCDKLIFVGSPEVGVHVARAAADNLTPVVLELGGKDPFVVCDDVDVASIMQTVMRGAWQSMGQNCAGPERFFVYDQVFDTFVAQALAIVSKLRVGPSLGDPLVDCGAICMGPKACEKYQALVDDAVKKGAALVYGGSIKRIDNATNSAEGCFYPPTILADVPENARIAQEEIFGPILCIFRVKGATRDRQDDEAVRMANNCDFALSSCAFSGSAARAKRIASQLHAGMSCVNDLEGTTYMNQSLPFGGCKRSGYDRFAGPEGLRGLCNIRSCCEDLIPFIRNSIPPPMHYPATGTGPSFAWGLIKLFFSTSLAGSAAGVGMLLSALTAGGGNGPAAGGEARGRGSAAATQVGGGGKAAAKRSVSAGRRKKN